MKGGTLAGRWGSAYNIVVIKTFEDFHFSPNRCFVSLDLLFGNDFERYVLDRPGVFGILGTFGNGRRVRVLTDTKGGDGKRLG